MSELTARLVKLGKDLGLEGPELRAFMKEERDREEKREAQERQEKKEAQESQEKREAQEREDKMRKKEQERKDRLELEKLKLQAEIENAKSLQSKKDSSTSDWIAKIPRMNPFSEAKGDTMDAFLFRFEMLVKAHNWPEDKKFLALSNLLTGESLKVLQTLSVEQQTYACLKQALLKKFLCTAADYNVKFRTAVPTNTEDADAFISRLETVFDKSLELSDIKKERLIPPNISAFISYVLLSPYLSDESMVRMPVRKSAWTFWANLDNTTICYTCSAAVVQNIASTISFMNNGTPK
ncbi:hypothetical protein PoB_007374900 [Plakobranchus ocellatus]|uniref:Uncharacterized protein n=1 Tax=Plakobranchus ocellatus TaxID=259542 RepID=A0AAV4DSL9_9GAST|nr:hypothetical protein PoB_007374900 [Plakobranchus ocellatus]